MLVYIVAYYIYKWRFILIVEKPSKIATHGIGAYFLTWIVALGLFFTILHPTAVFTYSPQSPITDNQVTFDATGTHSFAGYIISYEWDFGDGTINTTTIPTIEHVYATPGNYTVNLRVTNNYGFSVAVSETISVEAPE
jgi:PKD repeat protein